MFIIIWVEYNQCFLEISERYSEVPQRGKQLQQLKNKCKKYKHKLKQFKKSTSFEVVRSTSLQSLSSIDTQQHFLDFPVQQSGTNGIFSYLYQQCGNINPHVKGLVKVKSSSVYNQTRHACNLLEWGTQSSWSAKGKNDEWIEMTQLSLSNCQDFVLKQHNFSPTIVFLFPHDLFSHVKMIHFSQ